MGTGVTLFQPRLLFLKRVEITPFKTHLLASCALGYFAGTFHITSPSSLLSSSFNSSPETATNPQRHLETLLRGWRSIHSVSKDSHHFASVVSLHFSSSLSLVFSCRGVAVGAGVGSGGQEKKSVRCNLSDCFSSHRSWLWGPEGRPVWWIHPFIGSHVLSRSVHALREGKKIF